MDVRWGFLGAGTIAAHSLAPAVTAAAGATLQAVAARDGDRAQALADAHGAPTSYADYAALLADPDVDAVYISLANDAHAPWTVAALEAGKDVLCEKPLALSAAEVDAVAAAAQRTGRRVVEASWYRWHPRVRLAQQLLGEIGPVGHVAAGFTFAGVAPGNYRLERAHGGGALYDVGCYAVSAALWALGGPPADVAARLRLGPTGIDVGADLVLSWEDGSSAEVHAAIDEPARQWLVITGGRGEIELREAPFTAWREQDVELWVSRGEGTERLPVPAADAYRLMVEEVSAALSGAAGWLLPLPESRDGAAVLDAAFASAARGGEPATVT